MMLSCEEIQFWILIDLKSLIFDVLLSEISVSTRKVETALILERPAKSYQWTEA